RLLHREPPARAWLNASDQRTAHVDEPRPPRRTKPLLRAADEQVDRQPRHVDRYDAESLNGVNNEPRADIPTRRADRLEIRALAGHRRDPRHGNEPDVTRLDAPQQRLMIRQAIAQRNRLIRPPIMMRARHPRIDVRGKLSI